MCTCAHMHTHVHTYIHVHIHTCTHTHAHTYTHTRTHTHAHTHTHSEYTYTYSYRVITRHYISSYEELLLTRGGINLSLPTSGLLLLSTTLTYFGALVYTLLVFMCLKKEISKVDKLQEILIFDGYFAEVRVFSGVSNLRV